MKDDAVRAQRKAARKLRVSLRKQEIRIKTQQQSRALAASSLCTSGSVSNIKDKTRGRNRKERRGA